MIEGERTSSHWYTQVLIFILAASFAVPTFAQPNLPSKSQEQAELQVQNRGDRKVRRRQKKEQPQRRKKQPRAEQPRRKKEKQQRAEQPRRKKEKQQRAEQQHRKKEKQQRAEQQRRKKEKQQRAEQQRRKKEKQQRAEQQRRKKEKQQRAEQQRRKKEKQQRAEQQRREAREKERRKRKSKEEYEARRRRKEEQQSHRRMRERQKAKKDRRRVERGEHWKKQRENHRKVWEGRRHWRERWKGHKRRHQHPRRYYSKSHWYRNYLYWWHRYWLERPIRVYLPQKPIVIDRPWPDPVREKDNTWTFSEILQAAEAMEQHTVKLYEEAEVIFDQRSDWNDRAISSLYDLAESTIAYNQALNDKPPYLEETIQELMELSQAFDDAKIYIVDERMPSELTENFDFAEYYKDELLWNYRQKLGDDEWVRP